MSTSQGQQDLQFLLSRTDLSWANLHGSRFLFWLEADSTLEYPVRQRLEDDDAEQIDLDDQDDNSSGDQWMNRAHPWFQDPEGPEDLWLDAEQITDCLRATHITPRAIFLRLLERNAQTEETNKTTIAVLVPTRPVARPLLLALSVTVFLWGRFWSSSSIFTAISICALVVAVAIVGRTRLAVMIRIVEKRRNGRVVLIMSRC